MKNSTTIIATPVLLALILLASHVAWAAPVVKWSTAGPQVRLGPRYPHQPVFTYVFAPEAVAKVVHQTLGGEPDGLWHGVDRIQNCVREESRSSEKHEVVKFRRGKRCLAFLVQPNLWKRLDTPQSLPFINEIIGATIKLPLDQNDKMRLAGFIHDVASLYQPSTGKEVLVEESIEEAEEFTKAVGRPPKDAADFRSLCADPLATRQGDVWVITANMVTINEGAVETWTLTVRAGKRLELTDIKMQRVRRPGSFYCERY